MAADWVYSLAGDTPDKTGGPAPDPAMGSLQNVFPLQTVGYGNSWRRLYRTMPNPKGPSFAVPE